MGEYFIFTYISWKFIQQFIKFSKYNNKYKIKKMSVVKFILEEILFFKIIFQGNVF